MALTGPRTGWAACCSWWRLSLSACARCLQGPAAAGARSSGSSASARQRGDAAQRHRPGLGLFFPSTGFDDLVFFLASCITSTRKGMPSRPSRTITLRFFSSLRDSFSRWLILPGAGAPNDGASNSVPLHESWQVSAQVFRVCQRLLRGSINGTRATTAPRREWQRWCRR